MLLQENVRWYDRFVIMIICFSIYTDTQSQSQGRAATETLRLNLALGPMGPGNLRTPMMCTAM